MEYAQKLFGKKISPDEMRDIRTQQRVLERQIKEFGDVEKKTTSLLKQNAKKNDANACKIFAKELAGIMDEMIEDTFESFEDSDIEEEAEEEVNKVLFELTDVGAPLDVTTIFVILLCSVSFTVVTIYVNKFLRLKLQLNVEEEEEEPELNEMQARLQALKS
ncbi:6071_t:CDS:2 [Racocetra fulgida]|uniref:6071_t:CDS:1 n=1 Tax=Racocetra fulgida TaxID=60492 RepID=A0A9N9FDI8_9GLOM|nr:6071_t:CDS:2 [Racocetra fulgida]